MASNITRFEPQWEFSMDPEIPGVSWLIWLTNAGHVPGVFRLDGTFVDTHSRDILVDSFKLEALGSMELNPGEHSRFRVELKLRGAAGMAIPSAAQPPTLTLSYRVRGLTPNYVEHETKRFELAAL